VSLEAETCSDELNPASPLPPTPTYQHTPVCGTESTGSGSLVVVAIAPVVTMPPGNQRGFKWLILLQLPQVKNFLLRFFGPYLSLIKQHQSSKHKTVKIL